MATASRGQDLLSSEFLTQLERLTLISRRAFRGRTHGERKSPRKGMSVEFSDYRQYGVGDDLRYVDWNIYGRLDRLYLKLFVDEEDLCLHLLLDGSGCMAEGWNPTRGRGQLLSLLDFAARLRAGGPTGLSEGLATYALRSREAGVAVLISDLLDPAGYEPGLKALLERRFDVHVIHVLAPEEMNPILAGDLRLTDAETGEMRDLTMDGEAMGEYRQRLGAFLGRAESFCRANEITYHRVTTDIPVEEMLLRQLKGLLLA